MALSLFGWVIEPGLGELDAFSCALVLESEVLDHLDEICLVSGGERGGVGVAGHDGGEDGEGGGAFGFVEEDDGDEEAEGFVAEAFLDEAEGGGGERGKGNA